MPGGNSSTATKGTISPVGRTRKCVGRGLVLDGDLRFGMKEVRGWKECEVAWWVLTAGAAIMMCWEC